MKAPDAHQNPATYIAALGPVVAAAIVLFKLRLSDAEQAALVSGLAALLGVAIPFADAIIRHGRSKAAAAQHIESAAQLAVLAARPEGDDSLVPPGPPQALVAPAPPAV